VNQFIQTRLRSFVNYFQDNWFDLLPCIDFAMATQPHNATGLSPAKVDLGYLPRMLFDWKARSRKPLNYKNRMSQQQSQAFAKQRSEAMQFVRNNLIKAQQAYEKQANRRRRFID
jgi:hypothetical protein